MAEKPDPELDALLDSAAKDFHAPTSSDSPNAGFDIREFVNPDESLDHEKRMKWEKEQNEMIENAHLEYHSDLLKDMEKLMQESSSAHGGSGISPDEISNRLKNLKLFGEGLDVDADKEKEFSEAIFGAMQSLRENLSEAFQAPNDGEDGESGDGLKPDGEMEMLSSVMQQMVLTLLSKDMLLPSFKEMSQKYPGWLAENKSKLSEADFKRYTEQLSMVNQIVAELEKSESEDDKKHLDRMIELMQKMQDLGQPPKDLTAQLGNALDDAKIESMMKDTGADQCNIM